MNIPLMNRLRKRAQRDVAMFEDVLVRVMYEIDNTIEIHGGTAIWRCYGGRRFSKDIDIYVSSRENWQTLKEEINTVAGKYNAKVLKLKDTGNLMFIQLLMGDIYSEIDINYKSYYKDPVLGRYENLDGSFYDVLTLPPDVLIEEKIAAYNDRKSITDLYDIRILLDHADMKKVKSRLRNFISSLRPPDELSMEEARLGDFIYDGPVPSFKNLKEYIKGAIA